MAEQSETEKEKRENGKEAVRNPAALLLG